MATRPRLPALLALTFVAATLEAAGVELQGIEAIEESLVQVRAVRSEGLVAGGKGVFERKWEYGTGFLLDDGIVVTARHSISFDSGSSPKVEVWHKSSNTFVESVNLYESPYRDVAVLWNPSLPSGHFQLARAPVTQGKGKLYVAGFPSHADYPVPRWILSRGVVTHTSVRLPGADKVPSRTNLGVLDGPVYSGESGSPVFDDKLRVVGMVSLADQSHSGAWNGRTYFVHAADLSRIVEHAKGLLNSKKGFEFLDEE